MAFFTNLFARTSDEEGQGLTEYALIIALIAVAVVGLLGGLGTQIGTAFTSITTSLAAALP
ncbi:MAG: Flp family type IVb pilin [Chloroflexota bacterium]|nr:MAG: Flp family type IVb pilin [Chloroflexota bacterium]